VTIERPSAVATRRSGRRSPVGHRRTDIQGLRALAVIIVVLSHARVPGAAGGYIGVDVFFVISGFLITSLLLREIDRSGRISIRGFYERRARRILPAATVVLVATVGYAMFVLPTSRVTTIAGDAIWSSFFLANVHFAINGTDYFAATTVSPLQHFWSLAVEEQFYLGWPLLLLGLMLLISRRRRRVPLIRVVLLAVLVIIAGSLIASAVETAISPAAAYFSTVDRAYELAGGALLAILTAAGTRVPRWYNGLVRAIAGWLGLIALVVMTVTWSERTPIPGVLGGLVVLATAAILASGIGGVRGPGRLLSIRPVRFVGDISYSLYLWHWPLLTLGLLPGWDPAVRTTALIAIAIVVAALSYWLVEQPFQKRSIRLPRKTGALLLWPVAVVLVVATSIGAIAHAGQVNAEAQAAAAQWYEHHPASSPTPSTSGPAAAADSPALQAPLDAIRAQLTQALAEADAGAPVPPGIDWDAHKKDIFQDVYPCVAWWEQTSTQICPVGDVAAARTVVLVGDSHAGQWISALDDLGKQQHFKLVPIVKPACNVYDVEQYFSQMPAAACNEFKTWARQEIASLKPESIVVAARGFDGMHATGAERDKLWRTGAESGIRDLVAISPKVYVLSDVPPRSSKAEDCLTQLGVTLAQCIATDDGPEITSNALTREAAEAVGARWVDTSPLICVVERCPLVVGGHVVYYDDNHLTVSWGREVASAMGQLLE